MSLPKPLNANDLLAQILANSQTTTVKVDAVKAAVEIKVCKICGAARPDGTDLRKCEYCGNDL
jgi:ribosomal protein L40E